jgi:hypothetical protein
MLSMVWDPHVVINLCNALPSDVLYDTQIRKDTNIYG